MPQLGRTGRESEGHFARFLVLSSSARQRLSREGKDRGVKSFNVTWLRREPAIYTAEIRGGNERTHLEWVVDSDFRFFPTVKDDLFERYHCP